jgi:hypothetical protein
MVVAEGRMSYIVYCTYSENGEVLLTEHTYESIHDLRYWANENQGNSLLSNCTVFICKGDDMYERKVFPRIADLMMLWPEDATKVTDIVDLPGFSVDDGTCAPYDPVEEVSMLDTYFANLDGQVVFSKMHEKEEEEGDE